MNFRKRLIKVTLLIFSILLTTLTINAQISFGTTDTLSYYGNGSVFPKNCISYMDLDGDNNIDILALTPFSIIVKKGNGDGSFSDNEVWYQQEDQIYSISNLYDINDDGYLDLALMDYPYLVVLTGSENGFVEFDRVNFDTSYGVIKWLDYDGDGNVDLIAESKNDIELNKNWESDLTDFNSIHQDDGYLYLFEIIDIDKDNTLDLIVSTDNNFVIYITDDSGDFIEVHRTDLGYLDIEYGDINLDGYIDFVYRNSNELYSLTYNFTNNNFDELNITDTESHSNLRDPKLIDLDNNNTLDLVFKHGVNSFSYIKNSTGTYGTTQDFDLVGVTGHIIDVFGIDVNEDNQVDLLIHGYSNQEIHLLNNDLTIDKSYYNLFYPDFADMCYADMDNDGFADIVAISQYGKALIFFGDASNTFTERIEITASFNADDCFVQDVNSDGIQDIVYTEETPDNGINKVNILYGQGNRQFSNPKYAKYFPSPSKPFIIDVDNDSITELLFFEDYGNTIAWFEGIDTTNSSEYFSMPNKIDLDVNTNIWNVVSGDWNNDNLTDLVAIDRGSTIVSVLLNNSSNNFNISEFDLNKDVVAVQGFEFNNDSILDLLAVTEKNSEYYLFICTGNNDGTFLISDSIYLPSLNDARYIDLVDIDSDDDMDILISQWDYSITEIVENKDTSFVIYNNTEIKNCGQGNRIFTDINLDGKTDILTSSWYGGNLMIQYNNSVIEPQISNMVLEITEVTNNSIELNINQEIKTNKLILVREDTSKVLSQKPTDNIFYTANSIYGIGSVINGAYVVYSGSDTLVEITGINNVQTYSLFVFEYAVNSPNNDIINYTDDYLSIDTITLNEIPYYTSTEITNATENTLYTYNVEAFDEDINDTLIISASTLPSWLNITDNENGTAVIDGTPLNEHIGTHEVVIELSDGNIESPIVQSFSIIVNQDEINSINKIHNVFQIYPNPSDDFIHLEMSTELKEILLLRIYNVDGRVLIEKKVINNNINISELSPGEYFIEVLINESRYVTKFIKR